MQAACSTQYGYEAASENVWSPEVDYLLLVSLAKLDAVMMTTMMTIKMMTMLIDDNDYNDWWGW